MTPGIIEKQHTDHVQSAFLAGFQDPDIQVRREILKLVV